MSQKVSRPEAPQGKINCHDEFELCYLRHQYIRKTTVNPAESEMALFETIVRKVSARQYYCYSSLFRSVGMEENDIQNISRAHLVSYLGLFSIRNPGVKHDEFVDAFYDRKKTYPTEDDLMSKDKADFTSFLKQRMDDLVRICRQKNRNIRGTRAGERLVYVGSYSPDSEQLAVLPTKFKKMGFKKLYPYQFDLAVKDIEPTLDDKETDTQIFAKGDKFYISLIIPFNTTITNLDMAQAGHEIHGTYNPEEILLHKDNEIEFEKKVKGWIKTPQHLKNKKLRDFIAANENNPRYTEEVRAARKMIEE